MRRHRIGQQLEHRQRADRLARTGFADQRNALAALDVERHAIDRHRGPAALMEGDRKIANVEQRLIDGVHHVLSASAFESESRSCPSYSIVAVTRLRAPNSARKSAGSGETGYAVVAIFTNSVRMISPERLARIERVADGFADEDQ